MLRYSRHALNGEQNPGVRSPGVFVQAKAAKVCLRLRDYPDNTGALDISNFSDKKAELDQFLASVEKRAYAIAMSSLKNPDDALDVVQEAMITLATKYSHKAVQDWPPLFYRILQNKITDVHRGHTKQRRWFGWLSRSAHDDDQGEYAQVPGPAVEEPDRKQQSLSTGEQILAALDTLPQRQREAFTLRAWEGLDVASTARAMGCSAGSVKTHYSRAVRAMRDQLGDVL